MYVQEQVNELRVSLEEAEAKIRQKDAIIKVLEANRSKAVTKPNDELKELEQRLEEMADDRSRLE
jgi:HAMP domain-containing protein